MMRVQIKLVLALLFLFSHLLVQAAFVEYNNKLQEGQKHLACLRLQQANAIFLAEISVHPDNVTAHYLLHYSKFYHIMVQQDKKLLADFEKSASYTLLKV